MASPENLQRVGYLAIVPALLCQLGTDPAGVLAAAGLAPDALDNPEGMIPFAAMGRLLEAASRLSHCPHFGLLVGQRIGAASLGLIGELMGHAPTLGVALRDLATHQHRQARGAVAYLLTRGDHALFGYAIYQPSVAGTAQICDGAAAAAFNIVRGLAGPEGQHGLEVMFARMAPADLEPYRRCFGVKLHFDAEQTCVLLPIAWLDRPVVGANPVLRKVLESQVAGFWRAGDLDIVTRLSRALRVGLLTGHIAGDAIAAELGMARRTFHRRLSAQGVNFRHVLDEQRYEFARQLLAHTHVGIGEISLILRYADPSVFTRAFVRWAGQTPREWRAHHLGGAAP